MHFETYPFEKLSTLLAETTPNPDLDPIDLTIGEPKFATPEFIQQTLRNNADLLNRYPKSAGEPVLKNAQISFVRRRFGVELEPSQLLPTFGTREVLFNFPQYLLHDKTAPVMAFTNPFYQIYEGAAIASRAKIFHLNLTGERTTRLAPDPDLLRSCDLVILNFPNNPTGASMEFETLKAWAQAALEYDFVLLNDECYSEIYYDESDPDPSLLQVAKAIGNDTFKNTLVVNSLSKRSSAPGVRSGFIAGDAQILAGYMRYRTYVGCASPLPLQFAATAAWSDERHVVENRARYRANFDLAREILEIEPPRSTFYLWMEVDDDLAFTKTAWQLMHLKLLPGSFLSRGTFDRPHVRIALVEEPSRTKEALLRIKALRSML